MLVKRTIKNGEKHTKKEWIIGKKSKHGFWISEVRLGIDFFHFRLRRFEEVGERLGSPMAGVEIDTVDVV